MEEKLYTAAEFAAAIGKTERQVYRYIKSGQVKSLTAKETGLSGTRIPASETLSKRLPSLQFQQKRIISVKTRILSRIEMKPKALPHPLKLSLKL